VFEEPLIKDKRKPQLRRMVYKLIEKLEANETQDFYLFKVKRERRNEGCINLY
jgi:dynein assembly factor with WDR repeat domains 1